MEDTPFAEDASIVGKRKRSSSSLVESPESKSTAIQDSVMETGLPAAGHTSQEVPKEKRARLYPNPSCSPAGLASGLGRLPLAVLLRITSYLDLVSLGRLMRVARTFQALLDPRIPWPYQADQDTPKLTLTRDRLWDKLRAYLFPDMPQSCPSLTAYESLCLVLGSSCQLCGRNSNSVDSVAQCVQLVWPFRIRYCISCLASTILKVGESTDRQSD